VMATSKHQVKGILISIAFFIASAFVSKYAFDLGRIFWIVLVLLFLIGLMLFPVWLMLRFDRE
jgi:hypothetical protein